MADEAASQVCFTVCKQAEKRTEGNIAFALEGRTDRDRETEKQREREKESELGKKRKKGNRREG